MVPTLSVIQPFKTYHQVIETSYRMRFLNGLDSEENVLRPNNYCVIRTDPIAILGTEFFNFESSYVQYMSPSAGVKRLVLHVYMSLSPPKL